MKNDLTYSKLLYDFSTDYDDSDKSYSFVLQSKDISTGYQIFLSYSESKISILEMRLTGMQYQVNHDIPPLSIILTSGELYNKDAIIKAIMELLSGLRVSFLDLHPYILSNLEKFVAELINDAKNRKSLSGNVELPVTYANDDTEHPKKTKLSSFVYLIVFIAAAYFLAPFMYNSPISTIHKNSSLRLTDFLKVAENRRRSGLGDETYKAAYDRMKDHLDKYSDNYVSLGNADYIKAIDALTNIALAGTGFTDGTFTNQAADALYDYYNSLNPFSNKRDIFEAGNGVFNTGDPIQDYKDYLVAMRYLGQRNINPFSLNSDDAVFNTFKDLKDNPELWRAAQKGFLAKPSDNTGKELKDILGTTDRSQSKATPVISDEEAIAAFKYLEGETDEWPSSN